MFRSPSQVSLFWFSLAAAIAIVVLGASVSVVAEDGVYSSGQFELGDGKAPPGFPAAADILLDPEQSGPDWEEIFDADGVPRYDLIAQYGGRWAVFVADDISLGGGFESTVLAEPGDRVKNGTADADHDIGNAYVYTTSDSSGNLIVYAGAERLGGGDSYLEFEFNQEKFRLGHGGYGHGASWEIVGERSVGDVVVRVSFTNGAVASMVVNYWTEDGWQPLADVVGEGCDFDELACVIANGDIIEGGPWPNFDTSDNPEEIAVNRFAEFGLNVGGLLGAQPEFATVQIRTPQDIAFGYFGEGS